ncbi:MAG: hypothetical protein M3N45_14590 [Actinomycetota bacterium]|nr:hypothetical protein [Actinomycetota bacterium]
MSTQALLDDLRSRGISLESDGQMLHVDAPVDVFVEELRTELARHKPKLLKLLEWEQRKLQEADRRGLIVRWSEYPTWIKLHDPSTGEWHEVRAEECLPGVVETANKHRRKKGGAA